MNEWDLGLRVTKIHGLFWPHKHRSFIVHSSPWVPCCRFQLSRKTSSGYIYSECPDPPSTDMRHVGWWVFRVWLLPTLVNELIFARREIETSYTAIRTGVQFYTLPSNHRYFWEVARKWSRRSQVTIYCKQLHSVMTSSTRNMIQGYQCR